MMSNERSVYGIHAVSAVLNSKHRVIYKLFVNHDRADVLMTQLVEQAQAANIVIEKLSSQTMNARFADITHQGVVAITSTLPEYKENDISLLLELSKTPCLILILDGVTDPHNLGACLRTADAAGVDFVIIPKDKSASITPTVSKVACGAVESVPVVTATNLVRVIDILKEQGIWIYGAASQATQSIYELDCAGSIGLIMGGEGQGLRQLTRKHCDGLFYLPMLGQVPSLNVSVAAGISLYEVRRQRICDEQ